MARGRIRVLILALLAASAVAAAALASRDATAQGARAFTSKAFTHKVHLKDASQAECIKCHGAESESITKGGRTVTNFQVCAQCHAKEKTVEVKTAPRKVAEQFVGFSHTSHRATSCAECHAFNEKTDVVTTPKDLKLCSVCHSTHDTAKPYFAGATNASQACATCHLEKTIHLLKPADKGKFHHAQHLPKDRAPVKADCLRCHAGTLESKDLRDAKLAGGSVATCKACHHGAPPKGSRDRVDPRVDLVQTPVQRFYTEFDHATHAKGNECSRCHEVALAGSAPKPGASATASPEIRYTGKLPSYEGCLECHDKWRVKDHTKPIQCGSCHVKSEAKLRKVEVVRASFGNFTAAHAKHPFVDGANVDGAGGMPKACAECHFRARPEIESRIKDAPFSHAKHLGQAAAASAAKGRFPDRETCVACHTSIEAADAPWMSKNLDLSKDCARCHTGAALASGTGATRKDEVPPFSHKSHLGSTKGSITGCESCHGFDGPKDRMTTPVDVLDCKRCHDHKAHADVTGQDLDKCILCHTGDSLFRPERGGKVPVPSMKLAQVTFVDQEHDKGQRCASCHTPEGGTIVERPAVVEVKHKNDPHVGLKLDSCNGCHARPKG